MRSAEQWVAHLLTVTILFGGVDMVVEKSSALPLDGAIQVSEKKNASGMAPARPVGEAKMGEELYNASCIVCHGPRATGGIGPRLANNPVLSNDQAFWKIVYEGRHVMPPLKGVITEEQMTDIRTWLQTLR